MILLRGTISDQGFGLAGKNLPHVVPLIPQRTGLPKLVPGTLNVRLPDPYYVDAPDAVITAAEYNGVEVVKLQRCVVSGLRAIIMRPDTHERIPGFGHGPGHIELLSAYHLRTALGLADNSPLEVEVEGDDAWWSAAR